MSTQMPSRVLFPLVEPFRIKSVEPIKILTCEERTAKLIKAYYNVPSLESEDVFIDLLTDSGLTALSSAQWAAIHLASESGGRSRSYSQFAKTIRDVMPFQFILPTHQGRAGEHILATIASNYGNLVPSNGHFDTTRANFERNGINTLEFSNHTQSSSDSASHLFGGNMDIKQLTKLLEQRHKDIPLVMLTLTNNSVRGLPVSMENIQKVRKLTKQADIPLFIDACRFAENAYFIQQYESGFDQWSVREIAKEIFSYADGVVSSAKKDALSNTGGWLGINNLEWATKAFELSIITEGYVADGGLADRDLEAIAIGLRESLNHTNLEYRISLIQYFASALESIGVPVLRPVGGHAVFVDAAQLLPNVPHSAFPAQTLVTALYICGGVRACDVSATKLITNELAQPHLVRLSIPRRVYTKSHLEHVVKTFSEVMQRKQDFPGLKQIAPPEALNMFGAKFLPIHA